MKRKLGPSATIFPVPAALVASGRGDRVNVLAVAWIGVMSSDPPMLAISLRKTRYSLELIKTSGDFSVNIPSVDMYREVDYCGLVSGRKVNKFEKLGFTLVKSSLISAPIIKECPYNMECRVTQETDMGKWTVLFAEIVETHIDEDKFDTANDKIDVAGVNPLVYCTTIREYWSMGKKLGDGFNAGKVYVK